MTKYQKMSVLVLTFSVIMVSYLCTDILIVNANEKKSSLSYEVNPETFSLRLMDGNIAYKASIAQEKQTIENLMQNNDKTSWDYPEKQISVSMEQQKNYVSVSLTSTKQTENKITFPSVSGEEYYLPLGEGKKIPANDIGWGNYLTSMDFSMIEQFSMPFFATKVGDKALVYILDNPNRNELHFEKKEQLNFKVLNNFARQQKEKKINYRIYLTDNDPAKIAKTYKKYVQEMGEFKTLQQKEITNPEIKNLYGAPYVYLFNTRLILPNNIQWQVFLKQLNSNGMKDLMKRAEHLEGYSEFKEIMDDLKQQDFVDDYQKNIICSIISDTLKPLKTKQNPLEEIEGNKLDLYASLPDVFTPITTWADNATTGIIKNMKAAGIDRAWIGLDNWDTAYAKPTLITEARKENYLIAPYDSYHSIHEKGNVQWNTADFTDPTLYDSATVSDINGNKIEGFNGVGRKLNPIFSFGEVQLRTNRLINDGLLFNSWFIDCDATGEVYDDYSTDHMSSKEEDINARLKRMQYISEQKEMVIGSEGGNDFAASTIAFAHGLELPSFSWMDKDMKDEDSEYFIGKYYSATGGVPDNFGKQVKVKDYLKHLFVDTAFDVPLYKLVYNDSVISTYHWDWSTLKIEDEVENRMIREVLYNIPPMYHLDEKNWEQWGETIINHHNNWSSFSKKAIKQEMTVFSYLNKEHTVQKTVFGENLAVIANFSDNSVSYDNTEIPGKSVLINDGGDMQIYTPGKKSKENL